MVFSFEKQISRPFYVCNKEMKLCMVSKLTFVHTHVEHSLLRNITHSAIITRTTIYFMFFAVLRVMMAKCAMLLFEI